MAGMWLWEKQLGNAMGLIKMSKSSTRPSTELLGQSKESEILIQQSSTVPEPGGLTRAYSEDSFCLHISSISIINQQGCWNQVICVSRTVRRAD
ncbi:hypothetical protein VTK73DRAFT_4766 [Phialemonium thermophilum]|uniref:Uncharacterized protein n=1 Tax=Phialemonium thermophilum TaxID=223376 RepID=A0ABR3V671_9PEZI